MTVIENKQHRWGWKVFEARGVEPVFPGERSRSRLPADSSAALTSQCLRHVMGRSEIDLGNLNSSRGCFLVAGDRANEGKVGVNTAAGQ